MKAQGNQNNPIIYIDDDDDNCVLVKVALQRAGISNVKVFSNPHEALRSFEEGLIPSLVVSDYNMPSMNGVDLLDTIRRQYPDVRSIIVSGTSNLIWHKKHNYQVYPKGLDFVTKIVDLVKSKIPD